ncbi:MAG: 1-acyl-sn-glycerol-3-phosphate acyltransferase, partial [bacterium]
MNAIKSKQFPLLYRFIRVVVKTATAVFFQKIELRHVENVPRQGPVIFVANHPNSIMDALVMGLVTKRKVNYIGHAGLFSNKLKDWFLRSCGVIPVYRREDAPEKMDQNVFAFQACYEVLERGGTIGIFPEGTSDMLRKVKRLKTGAARIALEAEARNGYDLGVQIIPIGLYFFSRSRFRSRVLMNVGEPMKLRPYFQLYQKDKVMAVQEITNII